MPRSKRAVAEGRAESVNPEPRVWGPNINQMPSNHDDYIQDIIKSNMDIKPGSYTFKDDLNNKYQIQIYKKQDAQV